MYRTLGTLIAVIGSVIAVETSLGQSGLKNLISELDMGTASVSGDWTRTDGELHVKGSQARLMLSREIQGSYALTIEFTRTAGNESLGVILPVGNSQCLLNMSVFAGEAHGIGIIDGRLARKNSTTIKPGTLKNDHAYRLQIEVDATPGKAAISSSLDGRPFLQWSGHPKSLTILDSWKLPEITRAGFSTNGEFTIHSVTLSQLNPAMRMTTPVAAVATSISSSRTISFEGKQWSTENAQTATVETFRGRKALHIKGGEETFVALNDVVFGTGTVDVDIASSTFSGIGIRGTPNGKVVEKLYFRPFNSGTSKHENTVQYSMLGRPRFSWRALREKSPGTYESGAIIKPNEWFHVRLEIKSKRLAAFVNDGGEPVLVVDPLLGDSVSGTIGVWGWDSYFSNFRFTPSD